RLRDLEAPLVKNFKGIETYPIDKNWKIESQFIPYTSPKPIQIPTVIGTIEEDTARGYLAFQIDGEEFRLDPTSEGEKLFVIFADETNGKETYGAGRFLYVDKPDSTGKTYIDFNKSYNPPCAFTKYATCPLPPKQNRLKIKITAGEKNFEGGH
ncbi:MAG: DUF1684 domain-containing protein, partial [Ignavibacteria bacterium]|nr:DUF1684 domain-containing protein [Ignavibacteria bacterium]